MGNNSTVITGTHQLLADIQCKVSNHNSSSNNNTINSQDSMVNTSSNLLKMVNIMVNNIKTLYIFYENNSIFRITRQPLEWIYQPLFNFIVSCEIIQFLGY